LSFGVGILLKSQSTDFIIRANTSIGAEYSTLDYNGGSKIYSPGGGMGIDFGVQHELKNNLSFYSTLGGQFSFIFNYENINGFTNETTYSFHRFFFTLGAQYLIPFSNDFIKGFSLGGGLNGHKPTKLKRTENNFEYEPISYHYALGFHTDAKFRFKIASNYFVEPGIRYRNLDFTYKDNSKIEDFLPEAFKKLNVNGVEFYLSFFKRVSNKDQ
jgi:hypothetical protein